ncbi:MAG: thioesterase family protein [Alphaproteobacteria bacterium]|nr:thioesterase family protein [Alphaproteobacteria bacterium]
MTSSPVSAVSPFFDLKATHNPTRWFLPLHEGLCVGPPGRSFMFGGIGMAAAVTAMERTCERPVIWATAQYLSYARPPSVVDFDVRVAAAGRSTSQARVVAHVGGTEILTVNAALGSRSEEAPRQWASPPPVPPPQDCPETERWRDDSEDLHARLEVRIAHGAHDRRTREGPSADGRLVLWVRSREGHALDSGMLAIMADHVPSALGAALGRNAGGNSLDNTLRIIQTVETPWVLCDISIVGMARGLAHGAMRLFSQDGRLLASASQSLIVRLRDEGATA